MIHFELREGFSPHNILFIHGNLASNRWWMPLEEEWKKTGVRGEGCLVYGEFRGCGKSAAPRSESEVDMHLFANDFIELVRSLNRGSFSLVGHSTGGLIAALMLAKAPELFEKAVLLDPVGARGVTFDPSMIQAFEKMKQDKALTAAVIGSTIHQNDANAGFFKDVIVEDAFAAVKSVGHLVLKALDGLDVREELAKAPHPVLVLHGEHDQLLPMADSKALADLFPKGRFEVFAGQGHCGNIEDPRAFAAKIQEFLL
ncbi:MAG TPA: alpha/beta hydrolase [Pseudobdellovibrionaceae bacterium]|nr:alpha/beta hydrolase [Pseudobdellovibrionaceae bacterium]